MACTSFMSGLEEACWSAAYQQMATGPVAAYRGEHERALAAFPAAGASFREVLITNPAVLSWRSEAGLGARQLGRHEEGSELIAEELELAERVAGTGRPRVFVTVKVVEWHLRNTYRKLDVPGRHDLADALRDA